MVSSIFRVIAPFIIPPRLLPPNTLPNLPLVIVRLTLPLMLALSAPPNIMSIFAVGRQPSIRLTLPSMSAFLPAPTILPSTKSHSPPVPVLMLTVPTIFPFWLLPPYASCTVPPLRMVVALPVPYVFPLFIPTSAPGLEEPSLLLSLPLPPPNT